MTSLLITLPIGAASFPDARADELDDGVLTITWLSHPSYGDHAAHVYRPDQWIDCTVFNHGEPVFRFRNRHYPTTDAMNDVIRR